MSCGWSTIPCSGHDRDVVAHLVNGSPDSAGAAVRRLNGFDVVVIQHEYGIYGGSDGIDVLPIVDALTVPTIIVLHTVLQNPTAGQRHILLRLLAAADVVVTMTHTAKRRLVASYGADPAQVVVIPHGAVDHGHPSPVERRPGARPLVLTWGLLGPGKGIEWAIDAMAGLSDLRPRYLVAGRTHPKIAHRDGEAYRDSLVQRARSAGVEDIVELDDRYLDAGALAGLVQRADVVLLPYDSREQVTSGVLIEAVAAGRPVVSTAFPHAIELLGDGTGLVVPQRDPSALEAALRRVLSEPDLAEGHGRAGGAEVTRAAVARGGRPLPEDRDAARRGGHGRGLVTGAVRSSHIDVPAPRYAHLRALTDAGGLYEHADASTRVGNTAIASTTWRGHWSSCVATTSLGELDDLREQYLTFVLAAQEPDGQFHNRRRFDLGWTDTASVEDCWGRALWGLGTACSRVPHLRDRALEGFDRGAGLRSPHPRAMAFAALGAAEVLAAVPGHVEARALITAAVRVIGRPALGSRMAVAGAPAQLRERGVARGSAHRGAGAGFPGLLADGLGLLELAARPADPRRAPVGRPDRGCGPGDSRTGIRPAADRGGRVGRRLCEGYAIDGRWRWAEGSSSPRRGSSATTTLALRCTTRFPGAVSTVWSASGATRTRARSPLWRRCSPLQPGAPVTECVTPTDVTLTADPARVLARLFVPGHELSHDGRSRASGVLSRILALPDDEVGATLKQVGDRYAARHRDLPGVLMAHYRRSRTGYPTLPICRRSDAASWARGSPTSSRSRRPPSSIPPRSCTPTSRACRPGAAGSS